MKLSTSEYKNLLITIAQNLKDDSEISRVKTSNSGENSIEGRKIKNTLAIRGALGKLIEIGICSQQAKLALEAFIGHTYDAMNISVKEYAQFKIHIVQISNTLFEIVNVLDELVLPTTTETIVITLPNKINNFDMLSRYSRDLHLAISQLIIDKEINGEETILGVENGSIKLFVKVGSTAAMTLLGTVIYSAAVIYSHTRRFDLMEQQLKEINVELKPIVEARNKSIEAYITLEAQMIHDKHFDKKDNEKLKRIEHSIKLFSGMINDGIKLQPAISASEEMKIEFPDFDALELVESKTKKIDGPKKNKEK